jgi:peptidase E
MGRQIVALGGGGFWTGDSPRIDDFLLETLGVRHPKVCFLGTGSGDAEAYVRRFYQHFGSRNCRVSHFPLFSIPPRPAREHLLDQDLIYVGGGSTINMLALWRLHGVDALLREAWERGTLLCGPSAGALCWFEGGVTASSGQGMTAFRDGLAFLPGSFCPHYRDDQRRTTAYRELVVRGFAAGVGVPDDVAVRYVDTQVVDVVTAREGATAYFVSERHGSIVESAYPAALLR